MSFSESATSRADENVERMAPVFRQEITGEEVKIFAALMAHLDFNPEKVLH